MSYENLFSIAFYNTENLFDYKNDIHTLDLDYTPNGKKKWGKYRYEHKINKIAKVISQIGIENCRFPPTLIGLAEIETKAVVQDIIQTELLRYLNYDCVHFESPDERGIDVALLYNKDFFEIKYTKAIPVEIYETSGIRDFTRDILYVSGNLYNEKVHVFINHWPSRRQGIDKTDLKRITLAKLLRTEIDRILVQNPNDKIIIMGDFNDDPQSESIQNHLCKSSITNLMNKLVSKNYGSLCHNGNWHLFDQIMVSNNMTKPNNSIEMIICKIYNPEFLMDWTGRNKGEPLRTYIGKFYRGGFSDHFPVYAVFKK